MAVNNTNLIENSAFLPPARTYVGVDGAIASAPDMMMGRIVIAPGSRTQRQFSVNADLALFVVEGAGQLMTGPAHSAESDSFEEKDFIFIERGEIFTLSNTADSDCAIVFTLVGVNSVDDLDRQFVEAPLS